MFLLGIVNCYLGIRLYANFADFEMLTWTIIFWTWIIVGFLIQLGGQIWFGQIRKLICFNLMSRLWLIVGT